MTHWNVAHRCHPAAAALADRHYSRQHIGAANMMPPGRCLVLVTRECDAVWGTGWPFAEWVRHAWAGAWMCTIFRNESPHLSSELIREAVAVTRWHYGEPPPLGMVTFVKADAVRRKRDPGRCFRKAGFSHVGFTQGGLWAFQLPPDAMPAPLMPIGAQQRLQLVLAS